MREEKRRVDQHEVLGNSEGGNIQTGNALMEVV